MTTFPRLLAALVALPLIVACCGPAPSTADAGAGDTASSTPRTTMNAPEQPASPKATQPASPPSDQVVAGADGSAAAPAARELATFGGGCFWCTEAVLEQLDGVLDVTSGYMGGTVDSPSYRAVCTGTTGHAEVVQVTFDPRRIRYETLLDWFFRSHDPTSLNRQGADEGTQYRSVVFTHSPAQRTAAQQAIAALNRETGDRIVTELSDATKFWPAEDYHQDYYRGNQQQGYCRAVIAPKLKKLGLDPKPDPSSDPAK